MSDSGGNAVQRRTVPGLNGGWLKPVPPGVSGNPAGVSKERRELYQAIEKREVPKVLALLNALYERALDGDTIAAKLWLDQVRGPLKRRDDDDIENAVESKLMELIQDAKRRREQTP